MVVEVSKVETARLGNKLFIFDGVGPLKYVNLKTNKLKVYKNPSKLTLIFRRIRLWIKTDL